MKNRLESLGSRDWRDTANVEKQTNLYKTHTGTQTLRPIQAAALEEAVKCKGLFLHGRVGCGKTLISGLLATALKAKRPLLLVPGGQMFRDAERNIQDLRLHWDIPKTLRIKSYNYISNNDGWLERNPSDCIIADEGHKLCDIGQKQSSGSSCALQLNRYLKNNTHVLFNVMSGTLSPHGDLNDYAHLLIWALRMRAPIPLELKGIKKWIRAMDGSGDSRALLGAKSPAEAMDLFANIMKKTPGCIISDDEFTDVPLNVVVTQHDAPEDTRDAFEDLRAYWRAPDGWTFEDNNAQFGVAALARQLANGFYYRHDPRPPDWFMLRRRAWTAYCRELIEAEIYTSAGQIKADIRAGLRRDEGVTLLEEWEEAAQSFPMAHVADWFALDALLYARDWAKKTTNGIIWVAHIEVGEALEEISGLPFYRGQDGMDIERDSHGGGCVIASIKANGTGKNLQYQFRNNLIIAPPANGVDVEQMLGRTHREGQVHPVNAEFYCACLEHYNAVKNSIAAARRIQATLSPQKMTAFSIDVAHRQDHPAWQKPKRADE